MIVLIGKGFDKHSSLICYQEPGQEVIQLEKIEVGGSQGYNKWGHAIRSTDDRPISNIRLSCRRGTNVDPSTKFPEDEDRGRGCAHSSPFDGPNLFSGDEALIHTGYDQLFTEIQQVMHGNDVAA